MNQRCRQLGLLLTRFALSAWVGAATLFVINGVLLVTSDAFDSIDRDHISLVRFPPYYMTGATLLAISLGGLLVSRRLPTMSGRRWAGVFVLTLVASFVMLSDYLCVYKPLVEMITPPGAARPDGFRSLHHASKSLNAIQVALCLLAACVANWPHCSASGSHDKADQ